MTQLAPSIDYGEICIIHRELRAGIKERVRTTENILKRLLAGRIDLSGVEAELILARRAIGSYEKRGEELDKMRHDDNLSRYLSDEISELWQTHLKLAQEYVIRGGK